MKTLKLLALTSLLALAIVGCSAPVNEAAADREKELENRIAELEQEIVSLEKETQPSQSTSNITEEKAPEVTSDYSIESLKKEVDEVISKTEAATPSGTAAENRDTFFELKRELENAEAQIDVYENYYESQYRNDSISHEDYRSIARELEILEEKVDNAEERLEITFRMDD